MPESITSDDAQYALDLVKAICVEVGPGQPGSPQERQRGALIGRELATHLGAGNVATEEFTLAPGAFLGWTRFSALLTLLAALLNLLAARVTGPWQWLSAAAAAALAILAVLPVILEFLCYREFVDPLFPKRQSANVIATLRKPGTVSAKRLLIVSGHHDSAMENTWLHFLGYGFFFVTATLVLGPLALLALTLTQLAGVITGNAGVVGIGTLNWFLLVYPTLFYVVFAMFFSMGRKGGGTVPGAADNLAASALAVAICRFLVRNPACIPDDTEIRFISFGSEEAGLRGSRRYVERHLDELRRLDARLLNFETIAHPEMAILTTDVNGTVKHSPEMVGSLAAAAARAGVPHKVKPGLVGAGGSDAGPFSQAGLKAATVTPFKLPEQMVAFYHQRTDRPEIQTMQPLLNCLRLTLEWIRVGGE